MQSSGLLGPREAFYRKYYADTLDRVPGRISIFPQGVSEEVLAWAHEPAALLDENDQQVPSWPVLLELPPGVDTDMDGGGVSLAAPPSWTLVQRLHLRSESDALRTAETISGIEITISPRLFDVAVAECGPVPVAEAMPAEDRTPVFVHADRAMGSLWGGVLAANTLDGSALGLALMRDGVKVRSLADVDTFVETAVDLVKSTAPDDAAADRALWSCALSVLSGVDAPKKWSVDELLNALRTELRVRSKRLPDDVVAQLAAVAPISQLEQASDASGRRHLECGTMLVPHALRLVIRQHDPERYLQTAERLDKFGAPNEAFVIGGMLVGLVNGFRLLPRPAAMVDMLREFMDLQARLIMPTSMRTPAKSAKGRTRAPSIEEAIRSISYTHDAENDLVSACAGGGLGGCVRYRFLLDEPAAAVVGGGSPFTVTISGCSAEPKMMVDRDELIEGLDRLDTDDKRALIKRLRAIARKHAGDV